MYTRLVVVGLGQVGLVKCLSELPRRPSLRLRLPRGSVYVNGLQQVVIYVKSFDTARFRFGGKV